MIGQTRSISVFPAVPAIGRELHISISTVKRAMRELVEAGYVKKESRFREGNRGQTSNLYMLFFAEEKTEQQKEEEEIQQEEQSANVSEKQMEKEEQFENTEKCEREASAYADVTEGGGQNDTTLNLQFNQRLKGEKEVCLSGARKVEWHLCRIWAEWNKYSYPRS